MSLDVSDTLKKVPQLCLGTVQLGVAYGAANTHGMPSEGQASTLIAEALARGVRLFDTARAYGVSELRLGGMMDAIAAKGGVVMTKLSPLEAEGAAVEAQVEASIAMSCESLQLSVLPYVLLHRAEHLQLYEGRVWQRLLALQQRGVIGKLGVSVSTPREALEALSRPQVACVQLPFNLLDARWRRAGLVQMFAARNDVLVCVRSVFLQGVLTQPAQAWPVLENAEHVAALLDGWVAEFGRKDRADLCLAYVRAQGWVDVVVLGMETPEQLRHNVAMFETKPLDVAACAVIDGALPAIAEQFLNPALWPKKGM